jgi:DNA-binding transcriptional regulator YdaS (Cro superfamily)
MSTPLSSYMQQTGVDDAAFAALIGKDRTVVNRIRRGLVRPTLEVAAEIEAKTNGAVTMQSWFPSKASAA